MKSPTCAGRSDVPSILGVIADAAPDCVGGKLHAGPESMNKDWAMPARDLFMDSGVAGSQVGYSRLGHDDLPISGKPEIGARDLE